MRLDLAAGSAVAVATVLVVVMDWIRTPLNRNIRHSTARERLPSTVVHGLVGAASTVAALLDLRWGLLLAAVWYSLVVVQAVRNWWLPYLVGTSSPEVPPAVFASEYADNVTVLPRRAGRPLVPDVQHTLIHLAVAAACVLCWTAAVVR